MYNNELCKIVSTPLRGNPSPLYGGWLPCVRKRCQESPDISYCSWNIIRRLIASNVEFWEHWQLIVGSKFMLQISPEVKVVLNGYKFNLFREKNNTVLSPHIVGTWTAWGRSCVQVCFDRQIPFMGLISQKKSDENADTIRLNYIQAHVNVNQFMNFQ